MRFRWQHYRGFEDTGWVTLEPLTMLLGANNVGKTSLYSPLLLLKQTLNSKNQSTSLLSEGEIFNAGRFSDFVRNHDTETDIVLSVDLVDSLMAESRQLFLDDIPEEDLPVQLDLIFGIHQQERVARTILWRYQV